MVGCLPCLLGPVVPFAPLQSRRGSAIRSSEMTIDGGQGRRVPEPPAPTTHRLSDGTLVRIRPVGPGDRDRLSKGFARLSPEPENQRFLGAPSMLSVFSL